MDGALLTIGIFTLARIGSKIGMAKPSLAPTAENVGKIFIYSALADASIANAKEPKWVPSS